MFSLNLKNFVKCKIVLFFDLACFERLVPYVRKKSKKLLICIVYLSIFVIMYFYFFFVCADISSPVFRAIIAIVAVLLHY